MFGDEPMIQLDINADYRGIIPMNQGKSRENAVGMEGILGNNIGRNVEKREEIEGKNQAC